MYPGVQPTALAVTDGSRFAAPYRGWTRSIGRVETVAGRRIGGAVAAARAGALADADLRWLEFMSQHLQVAAFMSKAVQRALDRAARGCAWPDVVRCLQVQAQTHARQAQEIVLYALDLDGSAGALTLDEARERWNEDVIWRGAREYLRAAAAVEDWGETLVAINLCFEPLVGQLVRRELGMGAARTYGDVVTPAVAAAGQDEWAWARDWTTALLLFVAAEPGTGDANRRQLRVWLDRWLPRAQHAALGVAQLADRLPRSQDPIAAMARVSVDQRQLAHECGLGPEEAA